MVIPACFLGSYGGSPFAHVKYRSLLSCQAQAYQSSFAKRKRAKLRCTQEQEHPEGRPASLDGELKEIIRVSLQDNPIDAKTLQESDRRVMDGITETGVKEIEGIAKEVKGNLEDLQRTVEQNAAKLIEEETQAVLEKYDQRREELLDIVKKDREIISNEIERIQKIADNVESRRGMEKTKTLREKAYFLMCSVFTVSALYYAWKGLNDADSVALTNSAIDAAVAAACAFTFSKEDGERK